MNSTLLIGYEEISRASRRIEEAANHMNNAAANIERALDIHQRFLDDWLQRFSEIIRSSNDKS